MTPGEIFAYLGHMGTLTINKMALPSMYQWRWCHIFAFIETNTIALGVQRFAAGAGMICITHASDWQSIIGPVIHSESKLRATRSSSHHVALLHTLSTIDTLIQNSGCKKSLKISFISSSATCEMRPLIICCGTQLDRLSEITVIAGEIRMISLLRIYNESLI